MNTQTIHAPGPPAVGRVSGAGLVSVSTTHARGSNLNPLNLPTVIWMADNSISIDRQQARVTRLRKGIGISAKLIHNMSSQARKIMVTLTYSGDNRAWLGTHMTAYINRVRDWYKRLTAQKLRYVWVAELQERGVIHYHCVFWLVKGVTMPKADKRGWWPHGMTKTEKAIKPIGYLMSYISKVETKNISEFPHGARIFGVGGLDKNGSGIKRWVLWPSYLQANAEAGAPYKPTKGGGFTNADTGEYFCSEFAPSGAGFKTFIRVHTHPRAIEAAGPFSWFQSATVH